MKSSVVSALFWGSALAALKVDLNDTSSIKDAAKSVATNLLTYYHGNEVGKTPGILEGPPPQGDYYWGEAAVLWNALIDYWRATGDTSYNDLITQGILWQVGPGDNFMPPNVTATLGNDDQGLWGMTAMTAAETNFTNPATKDSQQWLALAQAVFDTQVERWGEGDDKTCNGGLRWQIPISNNGYDYKNSISTGVMFNLASRLAHLTGNATYADWAEKTYGWMEQVGFLDARGNIYDGAHTGDNCTDINKVQFSYNLGVFIQGAAHMYNTTSGGETWRSRLATLTNATGVFTKDDCVPVEIACEDVLSCTTDMLAFKSIFLRGLATASELAPFTNEKFSCVFEASAQAVASTCSDAGADKGAECGFVWTTAGVDEDKFGTGAGQQMNALEALAIRYQIQAGGPAGVGNGTGSGAAGGNGTAATTGGAGGSGSPTGTGAANSGTGAAGNSGAGVMRAGAGSGLVLVLAAMFGVLLA